MVYNVGRSDLNQVFSVVQCVIRRLAVSYHNALPIVLMGGVRLAEPYSLVGYHQSPKVSLLNGRSLYPATQRDRIKHSVTTDQWL